MKNLKNATNETMRNDENEKWNNEKVKDIEKMKKKKHIKKRIK